MKFLALGLLMFLQAGQHSQQAMQIPRKEVVIPPLHCYAFSDAKNAWVIVPDSFCISKRVSIDDGVTPGGKVLFSVPKDWDCRVFSDNPNHNTLIGVVCTKPKQK